MAKHGVLVESLISATNIDALNRSFVATKDIDGGGVISITAPTKQGDNVWTAEAGLVDGATLAITYNPQQRLVEVNGKEFAGLSDDDRDYTNLANKTGDAFIPAKHDTIVITSDDITDATLSVAKRDAFLVPTKGDFKWTAVAEAPASGLALRIENEETQQYPPVKGTIGFTTQKAFRAVVVSE